MKTYFYRRQNGEVVRIECEQMFWSGTACVFVRGGLASAVVSLLPGELVVDEQTVKEEEQEMTNSKNSLEKGFAKLN